MAFGCVGLLLFVVAIALALFAAHFWGGFEFREAPQPTPAELRAAVSREFWWIVWHRLLPWLALSISLFSYGAYARYKERQTARDSAPA